MIRDAHTLAGRIREIHAAIRDEVVAACERNATDTMARLVSEGLGDTVFEIDRVSETMRIERFEELARERSFVLVVEGQGSRGGTALPRGIDPEDAELWIIVDPIDGSRGLMYQKRSAWILTGVAPNRGEETTLADIELAVQTEIPTIKQHLCDGPNGERLDRFSGEREPFIPTPSRSNTIAQVSAALPASYLE